jgi:hypothetical protein
MEVPFIISLENGHFMFVIVTQPDDDCLGATGTDLP